MVREVIFMKKKFGFGAVFYTVGTIILLSITVIVAINFTHDSRLLGKTVMAQADNTSKTQANSGSATDSNGTFKYDKNYGNSGNNSGNNSVKPKDNSNNGQNKQNPLRVEIINCSSERNLGQQIKGLLQANGVEVVLISNSSERRKNTSIIVRSDKSFGGTIQGIIKTGEIVTMLDAASKIDATIKLGEDLLP
jgi:hypothetical protein